MAYSLPLDKMSNEDKIEAMELLWDNLCKDPESILSPEWHAETLKSREKEIKEGGASFSDFSKVKERIRERIK